MTFWHTNFCPLSKVFHSSALLGNNLGIFLISTLQEMLRLLLIPETILLSDIFDLLDKDVVDLMSRGDELSDIYLNAV